MSFLDNFRIRRTRGGKVASMDREATADDLDALREFARTRQGVEFFVEPETMVTDELNSRRQNIEQQLMYAGVTAPYQIHDGDGGGPHHLVQLGR